MCVPVHKHACVYTQMYIHSTYVYTATQTPSHIHIHIHAPHVHSAPVNTRTHTHTHAASAPVPGKSPTSSSLSLRSPLSTASTSALSWAVQGTYGCSRVDSGSSHTAPKQSTQGILKTRDSWIQVLMALRMWSQRSHPSARFASNPVT